jgi:hypothetical protein
MVIMVIMGNSFKAVSILGDSGFDENYIMGESFISISMIGDSGFAEYVLRIAPSDCVRRMLTQRTRGAHAEAWKAGRDQACRNASMNVNVCDVQKREK